MADGDTQRPTDEPIRGDRVRRRYERGFAQVPRALLTNEPPPTSNAVHCFALLDMHADYQTGACYPAQSTLMREMGVSRRTVQRALDELEQFGFVEREPRLDPRYGRVGTDYDLYDRAEHPPVSLVAQGRRAGDTPPMPSVALKQDTEMNKKRDNNNNNNGTGAPGPDRVVVSAASPPDWDIESVLALMTTLAPDVPAAVVEQWLSNYGGETVVEHLDWLKTEIDAGRRVDSRGGWLRDSFGWSEPPASYRRVRRERERRAQQEAARRTELAQAEQAAAAAAEDKQRLQALRAAYFALRPDRQAQIYTAARVAVTAGPAGRMIEVPPASDAWEACTVGASMWRQAIGEILRREG